MKAFTIRVPDYLHNQLKQDAGMLRISIAEAARIRLEKLADRSENQPNENPEIIAAMAAEVLQLREDSAAIRTAIDGVEEVMRDLAIAVQRLYQPPTPAPRQAPPVQLEKRRVEPPSFPAWAADKPWADGEDKTGRAHRLAREFKREFDTWPANYTPPAGG